MHYPKGTGDSREGETMSVEQWGIVIGVIVSALLALTPWMLMVHARLAVLTATISSLEDKVDKLASIPTDPH